MDILDKIDDMLTEEVIKSSRLTYGPRGVVDFIKEVFKKDTENEWFLRKIIVKNDFSIIMHPENWKQVLLAENSNHTTKFTDEQGFSWKVEPGIDEDNIISFTDIKNNSKFKWDSNDLIDRLN